MNSPSQTIVNVPINEWNNLQEKLKSLTDVVNSKSSIAFNDSWQNGTIKIISLDEAFMSFMRNIENKMNDHKQQWQRTFDLEHRIKEQDKEINELKKQIQVKK